MSEFVADAAPAAPEPSVATVDEQPQSLQPLDSRGPEKQPEPAKSTEPAKKPSIAESLAKAEAQVTKNNEGKPDTKAKVEAKPEPKAEDGKQPQVRDKGKFVSQQGEQQTGENQPADQSDKPKAPHDAPPQGFYREAQAEWDKTPESVRKDVHRRIGDVEKGLTQYQEHYRTEFEPIREFVERAKAHGQQPRDVIERFISIDSLLKTNPVEGINRICRNIGIDPRALAAHILGQPQPPQDQVARQTDQQLRAVASRAEAAEKKADALFSYMQEQDYNNQLQMTVKQVEDFYKDHPRMDELAEDIQREIQFGYELPEAYERAERLSTAPARAQLDHDPQVQHLRGQKSLTGAPSAGSAPGQQPPSSSIMAALKRAANQAA